MPNRYLFYSSIRSFVYSTSTSLHYKSPGETIDARVIQSIILNKEKLRIFLKNAGERQECPLLLHLFNIVLGILAITIRQLEEITVK